MRLAEPPTAAPTQQDESLVRRGAQHVRIGLALGVVGSFALFTAAIVGAGAGKAIGVNGWIGAVLTQVALVVALLAGSRIARGLIAYSGICNLVLATIMAVASLGGALDGLMMQMPPLAFAACIGTMALGNVLATLTPAARAWFDARRAMFAARRKAKTLAEWRRAL